MRFEFKRMGTTPGGPEVPALLILIIGLTLCAIGYEHQQLSRAPAGGLVSQVDGKGAPTDLPRLKVAGEGGAEEGCHASVSLLVDGVPHLSTACTVWEDSD